MTRKAKSLGWRNPWPITLHRWKTGLSKKSLWGAEFSLRFSRIFGNAAAVYNAVGCMTRVAQFLVHALFALNEEYFVSDKYAGWLLEQFALRPRDFTPRLAHVLSNPGGNPTELGRSFEALKALWLETVALTAGMYKPHALIWVQSSLTL
jgi:hypothetical protein